MHVETDFIRSEPLSQELGGGGSVWLKLENQQISGSFKYRGISLLCQKSVQNGCKRFVCSSGGNAGLAATVAAGKLDTPITVYVPESTPKVIREKLENLGAAVVVHGKVWNEANDKALEAAEEEGVAIIHPFDNQIIWEGHSSIITELYSQFNEPHPPDLIVASVGGGGLMNGILQGMDRVGWSQVPFVAMETVGADSLNACVREGKWVELDDITSIAKCLGAKKVSKASYDNLSKYNILSCTVSDKEALKACVFMADKHNIYIPPACGTAISAATSPNVIKELQEDGRITSLLKNVVIIVCGGSGVDRDKIEEWRKVLREN